MRDKEATVNNEGSNSQDTAILNLCRSFNPYKIKSDETKIDHLTPSYQLKNTTKTKS